MIVHEWQGTRADLIADLSRAVDGWLHHGKPELADQARDGVARLEQGEPHATVGHAVYVVTDH